MIGKRILEKGPWFIHKDILVIKEWNPTTPLRSISFLTTPIWAQFHGLQPAFISKENIWKIGDKTGSVLEIQFNKHTKWKPFVKVQLDIHVNRPLFPGFFLPMQSHQPVWIQVKYERIQDLCFRCGRLGHNRESCSEDSDTTVASLEGEVIQLFGPWL
ncbi:hypothetical protein UlMin_013028 [Ulmus minor]